MIRSLVVMLSWILLAGCGTDSGNPGIVSDTTSEPVAQDFIGGVICERLATCGSVETSTCRTSLLSATEITSHLGLDSSVYATLSEAVHAEASGQLRVNSSELTSCQNAIAALACNSSLVNSAYSQSQPANFNQTYFLLSASPSCSQFVSP